MAESKIEIKVGGIEFSGQGDEKWLSEQLDKVFIKIPELLKLELLPLTPKSGESVQPEVIHEKHPHTKKEDQKLPSTLSAFLKEKDATTNQNLKFLATAVYLQLKGTKNLTTTLITSSLKDSQQSRLGNASMCLNQNVKKGLCEKDGNFFFVTEEGIKELIK